VDERRLTLRHEPAERLGLDTGTVDYVCSTAFLEHVPDPAAVVAETARVTRRGGVGVHLIDGTDHWRYGDPTHHPLDFLRTATSAPLVHGSNRVRPLDYLPLFAAHGFEVVHCDVISTPLADGFQATLAEPFRSMPLATLEAGGAYVYVRRR
jgi:SAM-dependent methyltransferase